MDRNWSVEGESPALSERFDLNACDGIARGRRAGRCWSLTWMTIGTR